LRLPVPRGMENGNKRIEDLDFLGAIMYVVDRVH